VSLIVEAKNDGPGVIANILLKNSCPTGSSYNGSFSLIGTYDEIAESWSISSLNANESTSLVLRCYIPDTLLGRTLSSTLVKTSSIPSIGSSSSSVMSAKMTIVPNVANISTTLSVNKNHPLAGEQLVFKIKILNNGPDLASSVTGNYACPQGTTYLGHQLSGGVSYSSASGNLIAGDIGNGAAVELSLKCLVNIGTTTISQTITKASTTSLDNSTSGDGLSLNTSLHAQCSGSYGSLTKYNAIGDGLTTSSAYEIGNADQLIDLQKNGSDDFDKKFILCGNLNFSGKSWTAPIGSSSTPFKGEFNGNNKIISQLVSSDGLFGSVKNTTIKNLQISSSTINCSDDNCGFFVKILTGESASTLSNLQTSADSTLSSSYTMSGGIFGKIISAPIVTLSNLTNRAVLYSTSMNSGGRADSYLGGIGGGIFNSGVNATALTNSANLSGDGNYIGGIFSYVSLGRPSSFSTLNNSGNITLTQLATARSKYGGVFGELDVLAGGGVVTVSDSVSSGSFTAAAIPSIAGVGGFVGYLSGEDASNYVVIDNSSVTADAVISNTTANASSYTGGFVGVFGVFSTQTDASIIKNSTSSATVRGSNYAGGFVGVMQASTQIQNCTSYGNVSSNTSYVGGFAGRVDHFSKISNSQTYASTVSGSSAVGGFVGHMASYTILVLSTAEITGSTVNSVNVSAYSGYAAGFAGFVSDKAKITNSTTTLTGLSSQTGTYTGGFIGVYDGQDKPQARLHISNCQVNAAGVTMSYPADGINYVGGFIGRIYRGGSYIENASTNLNVSGTGNIGGFVGAIDGNTNDLSNIAEIYNSQATGHVTCSGSYCGGFVGSASMAKIEGSSATGNVTGGVSYHGGFAGQLTDASQVISSSATGNVASTGTLVGGFVGNLANGADVTDSKVVSTFVKGKSTGGFIGQILCSTMSAVSEGECKVLRNYAKITEVGDFDNGNTATSTASGFIGSIRTGANGSKTTIQDNFSKVTNIKTLTYGGGFAGLIIFSGTTTTTTEEVILSRNFVAGGTLQMALNAPANFFGGFIGYVSSGTSANKGKLTVEDNYTSVAMDATKMLTTPSDFGAGGFIGYNSAFGDVIFRRNYTTTPMVKGNTFIKRIGGFAGMIYAGSLGYTEPIFQDNFTAVTTLSQAMTSADFFVGIKTGTPVLTNNYYSSAASCTAPGVCNGSVGGTPIVLSTLYNTTVVAPLSSWDFTNVWQARVGAFPSLRCSTSGTGSFCTEWNSNQ